MFKKYKEKYEEFHQKTGIYEKNYIIILGVKNKLKFEIPQMGLTSDLKQMKRTSELEQYFTNFNVYTSHLRCRV